MRSKPTAFVTTLGLLSMLFGLFGIAVVVYLHANPASQFPSASSPLVKFMGTSWGVITNGALAVAGFGILRLKNWGRILALLYAVFSIVEYLINSASIPQQQLPTGIVFAVTAVPLMLWIALIVILTRPSITKQFKGSETVFDAPSSSQTEPTSNEEKSFSGSRSMGWNGFLARFWGAFVLYAGVSHVFFPYPMTANIYSPLKILVYYLVGYLGMFLSVYLVISVPTVIVAKIVPKCRSVPIPRLLSNTLLPALIIGGILIYGGWYGSKIAGMSP